MYEKYKLIVALMLVFLLVGTVNASLGYYKKGDCVNIKTILDSNSATLSTLSYPNGTYAVTGQAMTKTGKTFNYTFCDTDLSGENAPYTFIYDYYDDANNTYVNDFTITLNGKAPPSENVILLFVVIILIMLFGIIFIIIKSVGHIVQGDFDILDWAFNWGLYFALLGYYQLQFYYLGSEFVNDWALRFVQWLAFPLVILPPIAFILSIFRNKAQIKKERSQW